MENMTLSKKNRWVGGLSGSMVLLISLALGGAILGGGIFFLVSNPLGWATAGALFLTIGIGSTVIGALLATVGLIASLMIIVPALLPKTLLSAGKAWLARGLATALLGAGLIVGATVLAGGIFFLATNPVGWVTTGALFLGVGIGATAVGGILSAVVLLTIGALVTYDVLRLVKKAREGQNVSKSSGEENLRVEKEKSTPELKGSSQVQKVVPGNIRKIKPLTFFPPDSMRTIKYVLLKEQKYFDLCKIFPNAAAYGDLTPDFKVVKERCDQLSMHDVRQGKPKEWAGDKIQQNGEACEKLRSSSISTQTFTPTYTVAVAIDDNNQPICVKYCGPERWHDIQMFYQATNSNDEGDVGQGAKDIESQMRMSETAKEEIKLKKVLDEHIGKNIVIESPKKQCFIL